MHKPHCIMVLIHDGNSEIGAHERSHFCCLISLKHLITSRVVTNPKSAIFLHACATCSELPSYTSIME